MRTVNCPLQAEFGPCDITLLTTYISYIRGMFQVMTMQL